MTSTPAGEVKPTGENTGSEKPVLFSVAVSVVLVVFAIMFVIGFAGAWFRTSGNVAAAAVGGLQFAISASAGIVCIGLSARTWQQLPVPEWVPLTASMATGFFVMHGLQAILKGEFDQVLGEAGQGFVIGIIAGIGMYWAQRSGMIKPPTHRPTPPQPHA